MYDSPYQSGGSDSDTKSDSEPEDLYNESDTSESIPDPNVSDESLFQDVDMLPEILTRDHTPNRRCRYRRLCSPAVRHVAGFQVAGSGFEEQPPVCKVAGSGSQIKVPPQVPVAGRYSKMSQVLVSATF